MKCITQRIRAIDDNEKKLKRQSIIDAATRLYERNPQQLPSVISIAREAGLAKGTVYLYFKTKEEIFLALLTSLYGSLLDQLNENMRQQNNRQAMIETFLSTMVSYLDNTPLFMPLASMGNSVIEMNVDEKSFRTFKLMLVEKIDLIAQLLTGTFAGMNLESGRQLLLHSHALIIGLWQMQSWPEHLKPIMQEAPFNAILPQFSFECGLALKNLWQGSLPH